MPYTTLATSKTPALIIYVLDVSGSMGLPLEKKRRIEVVTDALNAALRQMVFRSTKGTKVAPRYRIAMFAYSDHTYDLLDGIKPVDEVANMGVPQLAPMSTTDTARAFTHVEKLLQAELPNISHCPAPLICHMTDGESGSDPTPVVQRIKEMQVPDGHVLIENIFISDRILSDSIPDHHQWSGIQPDTPLTNTYANLLRNISSPLPETYHVMMLESGYQIAPNAVMMLPGVSPELVEMGFVMSTSTPVSR
jgi:uncharacterized protein YegL